jgi:hypothetical protein
VSARERGAPWTQGSTGEVVETKKKEKKKKKDTLPDNLRWKRSMNVFPYTPFIKCSNVLMKISKN